MHLNIGILYINYIYSMTPRGVAIATRALWCKKAKLLTYVAWAASK
jgi:hypothetical protein